MYSRTCSITILDNKTVNKETWHVADLDLHRWSCRLHLWIDSTEHARGAFHDKGMSPISASCEGGMELMGTHVSDSTDSYSRHQNIITCTRLPVDLMFLHDDTRIVPLYSTCSHPSLLQDCI